ncbi:MAG: hypothetical protein KDJ75_10245 [Alphaproteobacteria bacterium]|nr:hypothetical protein [Alphaproteobacteria bacterium]
MAIVAAREIDTAHTPLVGDGDSALYSVLPLSLSFQDHAGSEPWDTRIANDAVFETDATTQSTDRQSEDIAVLGAPSFYLSAAEQLSLIEKRVSADPIGAANRFLNLNTDAFPGHLSERYLELAEELGARLSRLYTAESQNLLWGIEQTVSSFLEDKPDISDPFAPSAGKGFEGGFFNDGLKDFSDLMGSNPSDKHNTHESGNTGDIAIVGAAKVQQQDWEYIQTVSHTPTAPAPFLTPGERLRRRPDLVPGLHLSL